MPEPPAGSYPVDPSGPRPIPGRAGHRWSAAGFRVPMFNDLVVVGGRPPIKRLAEKYPHLFGGHGASLTSKLKDLARRDVGTVSGS